MASKNREQQLKEHALFFPLLRLITNSSAALISIHQKYGDLVLVRFFNKKLLFIAKPEHIEQVFSHEAKGNAKRDALHEAKKAIVGNGLANSKGETWTNQRRIMQPFFNKDAVNSWDELIIEETMLAVNRLKTAGSNEINLTQEMKMLVQSIIARILFGQTVDQENKSALMKNVDTIMQGAVAQLISDLLGKGWLKYFFILRNSQFKNATKRFSDFVSQTIQAQPHKVGQGLIAQLSRAKDKNSGYTIPEDLLRDEAINLFLAGQDTTINTVVWFFYLIGKHKAIHEKITDEVLRCQHDPLTPETLNKLAYTKAALHETLRLYPAGTGLTRDPVVDNLSLDDISVSRDTTLFVSLYATHHDPKLWERPNSFYPDHFINPEVNSKRHRYAFLPFGGGIHNCIGRHLAELEMMLIIISLLREFRFETNMTVKTAISITLKPDRDVIVKVASHC